MITIEQRITRELARLRMWREVAQSEDEVAMETAIAHHRIDDLLDELEQKQSKDRSQSCPVPLTPQP